MGMAITRAYPRPEVRKVYGNVWRVTWCDISNRVWYYDFFEWRAAINYAIGAK
jgi:hypothetical protein